MTEWKSGDCYYCGSDYYHGVYLYNCVLKDDSFSHINRNDSICEFSGLLKKNDVGMKSISP